MNDLLDFSKIEAGYMELVCQPVNIAELVDAAIPSMASLAAERGLTLNHHIEPLAETFEADSLRLQQVLLNLVSNALKFTDAGGTVTLRARPETRAQRRGVRFEIEDTGVGIPGDKLDIVFDSFRQVDGSHTRRKGGTGLGLAISKRLVELHGGVIGVTSTLHVGTTFWCWLPLAPVTTSGGTRHASG